MDEVLGQESVRQALSQAISHNQLAHAYLFCGPRGTGKTSTARILAKIVNCEKSGPARPCNNCSSCKAITNGSSLDFIEIDAASNRGIDDVRALRENIKLAPSAALKKVYVIDEVHMLTTEAFNALLKTLEEPPEHVLFILATTEVQKIPQTIMSRVQRLDFQKAALPDLVAALEKVVRGEGLEVEPEALRLLAARSEGSFRDCLKLLDQLAASGKKISRAMVEVSFRSGSFEDSLDLLTAINSGNAAEALKVIKKQVESGVILKEFIGELLNLLRVMLFVKHGAEDQKEGLGSDRFAKVKALADSFEGTALTALINSLHKALEEMKFSSIASLPLEIAAVENSVPRFKPEPRQESKPEKTAAVTESQTATSDKQPESPDTPTSVSRPTDTQITQELSQILGKWQFILESIRPYNYSLEALLRQVKVLSSEDGLVTLEVPYTFHQRILEAPKSRSLLESVLAEVLGKEAKIHCVLGARPVRVEEVANVELAADDEIIRAAAEIFNS